MKFKDLLRIFLEKFLDDYYSKSKKITLVLRKCQWVDIVQETERVIERMRVR